MNYFQKILNHFLTTTENNISEQTISSTVNGDQKKKIILGLGISIMAMIAIFLLFGKKTINLNDYLEITTSGYEGYGNATWNFDYSRFEEDYQGKLKFKNGGGYMITPVESVEIWLSGNKTMVCLQKNCGLK